MSYPFEVTKKGLERVSELSEAILSVLAEEYDAAENRFVWDGKKFYWNDLEAGHLEIDFFSKKMRYRMQRINKAQEPLLRAIGWKSSEQKRVLDMTAGLGRDACLLFFAGCNVVMFERNPVLQLLLENAVNALPSEDFTQSLTFVKEDSILFLKRMIGEDPSGNFADVIYMDPMYPERKKSALVKKELRIIRNLVGADMDSEELLSLAMKSGVSRVVVKRPKGAGFVAGLRPNHSVESPNTRFDVYLSHTSQPE